MLISELIETLQKTLENVGDTKVYLAHPYDDIVEFNFDVRTVKWKRLCSAEGESPDVIYVELGEKKHGFNK